MNATAPAAAATTMPAPAKLPELAMGDRMFIMLAREIAMDIHPLETILKNHEIPGARWTEIINNTRFQQYLAAAVTEWNSALNTADRVRIKSLAFVEELLPEMYAQAHNKSETLTARVKILEAVAALTPLGNKQGQGGGGGERFSVTINLGADKTLEITAPSPKVIDASDQ